MSVLTGKRVLVVDDEPMLREILRDVLELEGAIVFEAPNGKEAFQHIKREPVDAVISDIRMPGGDGIELLQNLRNVENATPIVLLITGFSDLTFDSAYDQGADAILSKPFDVSDLIERVSQLMKSLEERVAQKPELMPDRMVQVQSGDHLAIGRGGFCVEEFVDYPSGTLVRFETPASESNQSMEGCGVVRWVRRNATEGAPAGIGIEFTYLPEGSVRGVVDYLKSHPMKSFIPKRVHRS